ncbi:MAG: hypothetical protein IT460_13360 [Planctomycetes bacterium]|nr:hypothetical protein [Planctomycetota bacterium]
MKPDRFRDKVLGRWSSHPDALVARARRAARWAFVPLGVVVAAAASSLLDQGGIGRLFRDAGGWFDLTVGAVGAALAFLLGAGLTARLSDVQLTRRQASEDATESSRLLWVLVGACFALGLLGPLLSWLLRDSAPFVARAALQGLAVLPLVGVLVFLGAVSARDDRSPLVALVALVLGSVALLTMLHDLGVAWRQSWLRDAIAWVLPAFYRRLERPFLGIFLLAPLSILLGATLRLWRATDPRRAPAPTDAKLSLWQRLWRWLKGLFARKPRRTGAPEAPRVPTPPPWVAELREGLGLRDDVVRLELPRTSPPVAAMLPGAAAEGADEPVGDGAGPGATADPEAARRALRLFFGAVVPTADQVRVLERFDAAWREALGEAAEQGVSAVGSVSPDLVVHGVEGSGRTTALMACAVYAALARGQRVLWLASDEERAASVLERLRALLARDDLDAYVGAERLAVGLRRAVEGPVPDAADPRILVSTPVEAERHLYGSEDEESGGSAPVRDVLLSVEVLLVDDALDGAGVTRDHVPFLLAKHRLVLDGHGLVPQVVASCPRLARVGATLVARRFLSEAAGSERNVIALDPPPPDEAWLLPLRLKRDEKSVPALVAWCVERRQHVVVHRPGLSKALREALAREWGRGTELVRVVARPDEATARTAGTADVVVVAGGSAYLAAAFRRGFGHPNTVLVPIVYLDDPPAADTEGVVPVLVGADAPAFGLVHLRSVLRMLPPGVPTAASAWASLGFEPNRLPVRPSASRVEASFRFDTAARERFPADALDDYVVTERAARQAAPVDPRRAPHVEVALARDPGDPRRLVLAPTAPEDAGSVAARTLHWADPDGTSLEATSDLALLEDLSILRDGETFVRAAGPTARPPLRVTGRRLDPHGRTPRRPVVDLSVRVEAATAEALGGGADAGLQWLTLVPSAGSTWPVEAELTGLLDEEGDETLLDPVRFRYAARVHVVLLVPRRAGGARGEAALSPEAVGGLLSGVFSTRVGAAGAPVSPTLGAALEHALDRRLPGWRAWARTAAYRLTGRAARLGAAAWVLVEPLDAGRTVVATLDALLAEPGERRALLDAATWFLERAAAAPDRRTFVRRLLHAGRADDGEAGDHEEAAAIVAAARAAGAARARSGDVVEPTSEDDPRRPTVRPVVEDVARPWDDGAATTPWAACVDVLWAQALRRFPDLDGRDLDDDPLVFRASVEVEGVATLSGTHSRLRLGAASGGRATTLVVEPGDGLTGAEWHEALAQALASVLRACGAKDGATVALRLWASPRGEDEAGHPPSPRAPLFASVLGGYRRDGLLLVARPRPESPSPAPEPGGPWWPGLPAYAPPDDAALVAGRTLVTLPPAPRVRERGGTAVTFAHGGRTHTVHYGFDRDDDRRRYLDALASLPRRIGGPVWAHYVAHDPYAASVSALADALLAAYGGRRDDGLAEFLLAFVQSVDYVRDTHEAPGDWPRFPSETLVNGGGDCEDKSILYAALLMRFGVPHAFLDFPGHVAVGVVGRFGGVTFDLQGRRYVYAEPSVSGGTVALGAFPTDRSAVVVEVAARAFPPPQPVSVWTADFATTGTARMLVVLSAAERAGGRVTVAVHARPRDGGSTSRLLGAAEVALDGGVVAEVAVPLAWDGAPRGTLDLDVVVHRGGEVAALWPRAASVERR